MCSLALGQAGGAEPAPESHGVVQVDTIPPCQRRGPIRIFLESRKRQLIRGQPVNAVIRKMLDIHVTNKSLDAT